MKTRVRICCLAGTFLALLVQTSYAQTGNYFAGTSAGASNTTGDYNTFVGVASGQYNTSGYANSFFGAISGISNTTGYNNTAMGMYAGYINQAANNNTTIGYAAGFYNESSGITFVGASAGFNNKGVGNAFFGNRSGYANSYGDYNTFLGSYTGEDNTTGGYNTFVGYTSGQNNTTGGSNTFVGYGTGRANTSGYYNSFLGIYAGFSNTIGDNNAFIGHYTGSNNETGNNNSFYGSYAGLANTTGSGNTGMGYDAGRENTTGSGNSYFGHQADGPNGTVLNNATAVGNRAYVSASNSLVLGSIAGVNGATNNVKVGIGTSAPAYQLQLSTNSAAKPGSSSWTIASDKRLKTDVQEFTDGLNVLLQVKPVKYRYNGKAQMPVDKEFVGIIAQEMKQIAPYTVGEFVYQDTTGKQERYLDYDASALTYVLVNAVKEQQKTIQAMQEEILALKDQLARQSPGLTTPEGNGAARLWQNAPNPYNRSTVIKYFVPESASTAVIQVFNSAGQEAGSFELNRKGEGQITLDAGQFAAGTYVYKLLIDGVGVDSKKLVLVK